MINQLMSLEVIVGLSVLLDKPVRLYNLWDQYDPIGINSPIYHRQPNRLPNLIGKDTVKRLSDILDWSNNDWILEDKNYPDHIDGHITENLFDKHYVNCQPWLRENEDDFRNGCTLLELNPVFNYNFINTLCFYCRFFFNRSEKVENALKQIKWKQPYIDLADDIAKDLGNFVGIHLRDTDNHEMIKVEGQHFKDGIDKLLEYNLPIILATDNPTHEKVQSFSGKVNLMEDIIRTGWSHRFKELPYHDEVVFGLITNLVLGHSLDFIGTPGSTFTAYIHRQLHFRGNCSWKFLDGVLPPVHQMNNVRTHSPGKYSWVEYPNQPTWWREWPECQWVC